MQTLQNKMNGPGFLYGVELVSTRGTMKESRVVKIRDYADDLAAHPQVDWVSVTDNAGGNPMLAPSALGKPILYKNKEVVIHLTCKDYNRNGLESAAWYLASEGFNNILAITGDAPVSGPEGMAKPVFDIDSVGLLSVLHQMNQGLPVSNNTKRLERTEFFLGAVTTNFKLYENEVIPQYLKLEKKIQCGAEFIINQVGYDSRKMHELMVYMSHRKIDHIPLIGNVFVLSARVAQLFNEQKIPGVVVSDELLEICKDKGRSPDKGKGFFLELAARQLAVYRGFGYQGGYLGGVHNIADLEMILEIEQSFSPEDFKSFTGEIKFSRPGEFFMFDWDPEAGLIGAQQLDPAYEASLSKPAVSHKVSLPYKISKLVHRLMFTKGKGVYNLGKKMCAGAKDPMQGPKWLRMVEYAGKVMMFNCQDCGDCSLPDIAFLCPESQCSKNQRNGPCGGTRDGKCEVDEYQCIWARAYDRLKYDNREQQLLDHAPVIQDQGLRGTSSWANSWLERDHAGRKNNKKDQVCQNQNNYR